MNQKTRARIFIIFVLCSLVAPVVQAQTQNVYYLIDCDTQAGWTKTLDVPIIGYDVYNNPVTPNSWSISSEDYKDGNGSLLSFAYSSDSYHRAKLDLTHYVSDVPSG